jgi:choline kinase
LTDTRPKCLVELAGRPLLLWQLEALAQAGVTEATVITGFGASAVEAALRVTAPALPVACRHNPFFAVADNIASCWIARDLLGADTLLINGDTLLDPTIVTKVLSEARGPITVTIDRKSTYDGDDMKVRLKGGKLIRIGKDLTDPVDGEAIGLVRFREDGGARFVAALEGRLRDPAALRLWYLSVIDELAQANEVEAVAVDGLPWAEVDFPRDLAIAASRLAQFDWSAADACATAGAKGRQG